MFEDKLLSDICFVLTGKVLLCSFDHTAEFLSPHLAASSLSKIIYGEGVLS